MMVEGSRFPETTSEGLVRRNDCLISLTGDGDPLGSQGEAGRSFVAACGTCAGREGKGGAYARATMQDGRLKITTDAANLFGIFADCAQGVISSSLRLLLEAGGGPYGINRNALCEQIVTGAIAGRETCFRGIERLNGAGTLMVGKTEVEFTQDLPADGTDKKTFRSRSACIDFQLEVLRAHFEELADLAGTRGASIGLSGGYDSRLMLLLAREAGLPLLPFTYSSVHHAGETQCAENLALALGLPLRKIVVRPTESLSDGALNANVEDALVYYDGRTNATMGTFGDVHTARTQAACLGVAAVNLNGLGGELYRNRERLPPYSMDAADWLTDCVIGPINAGAFKSEADRRWFLAHLSRKYGELLGVTTLKRVCRHLVRRHYREVWLPYFAGPRISAENRVGPAVMPFADARVSAAALMATPFLGSHGEFEGAMMRRLDERIARLPSSYGPGLAKTPLLKRTRDLVVSMVPMNTRLVRHRILERSRSHDPADRWKRRFAEGLQFLDRVGLPLSIEHLLGNRVSRDRTLYIAEFLHRHRACIDLDR